MERILKSVSACFLLFISGVLSTNQINLTSAGNILATHYINYTLTATLSSVSTCSWSMSYPGFSETFSFYGQFSASIAMECRNGYITEWLILTCNEQLKNGTNQVETNVTILQPLPAGTLNASVLCFGRNLIKASKTIIIKNCTTSDIPSYINLLPQTQPFKGKAVMSCSNGGLLYNFNGYGKLLQSNVTTECLSNARWRGQDTAQCWKAPTIVTTNEFNSLIAGTRIELMCSYMDELPNGTKSRYFLGDNSYTVPKEETFVSPILNASDHGKPVSCQAVTPFTDIITDAGRSASRLLDVQFAPYQDQAQAATSVCKWEISRNGFCAVRFSSNPKAVFTSLVKKDVTIGIDASVHLVTTTNDDHIFLFERKMVTEQDFGRYTLLLSSPIFPGNHTINFDIIAVETCTSQSSSTGFIAGIVVLCAVLLVGFVCGISYHHRKVINTQKQLKNSVNESSLQTRQIRKTNHTSTAVGDGNRDDLLAIGSDGYLEPSKLTSKGASNKAQTGQGKYEEIKGSKYENMQDVTQVKGAYENPQASGSYANVNNA